MAYLIEILDDAATRQIVQEWERKNYVRRIEPPRVTIIETTPGYIYQPTPEELEARQRLEADMAERRKQPPPPQNWAGIISKETADKWLQELEQTRDEWDRNF